MSTVISELGEMLRQVEGFRVEYDAARMLVTLPVGNGRTQTVKAVSFDGRHGNYHLIHLQSRACVVTNPGIVRQSLAANRGLTWGGLVLETSTSPNTLDVTFSLMASQALDINVLLAALQNVANLADGIEQRVLGTDCF